MNKKVITHYDILNLYKNYMLNAEDVIYLIHLITGSGSKISGYNYEISFRTLVQKLAKNNKKDIADLLMSTYHYQEEIYKFLDKVTVYIGGTPHKAIYIKHSDVYPDQPNEVILECNQSICYIEDKNITARALNTYGFEMPVTSLP